MSNSENVFLTVLRRLGFSRVHQIVRTRISRTLLSMLAALLASITCAHAAEPLTLYHRFSMAVDGSWTAVSINLTAGDWRVGAIDGRPATPEEVKTVLQRLSMLKIGGSCDSAVDGHTLYQCGLALAEPDFAGLASDIVRFNRRVR
jgi:hypothetical protein